MCKSDNLPPSFGGLDLQQRDPENSQVLIWPVPFERTVTYGSGTSEGPSAIIDASCNMELFDEELGAEISQVGIHTLPAMKSDHGLEEMMTELHAKAQDLLKRDKFICMVGGEHSISPPVVRAFREKFSDLCVLQIDAHADLRDSYNGTPNSHACAMRRIVEICPAVQVGIRSISLEEARSIPLLPTKVLYAKDMRDRADWIAEAVAALSPHVYLTLDVDGLDPSVIQATGTPEPGGLTWYQVLDLIRAVAQARSIVGMDVVELCRTPYSAAASFTAAKLLYKTLGYIFREQIDSVK